MPDMPNVIYAQWEEGNYTTGRWRDCEWSYMPNDATLLSAEPYVRSDKVQELVEAACDFLLVASVFRDNCGDIYTERFDALDEVAVRLAAELKDESRPPQPKETS